MWDLSDGGDVEEAGADTLQDALGEEDLPVLGAEGEHHEGEAHEERGDDEGGEEVAAVEERAGSYADD